MPLTLYWYILRDLLKLLALSTGVLVLVLSLAFAFAPMTEGMLGPLQLLRVVFYLMPATLPYALPFAAAFAATLVFFRLAADNEITATNASGISYRSMCIPVATLGLVLTLAMFLLGNWIVPWFWQRVTDLVERDVTRLVIQQLKRKDTIDYSMGGRSRFILRADAADEWPIEPGPDAPFRRIALAGVAAGVVDARTYQLKQDFTSEKAVVDIYREGDALSAVVRLIRPIGKDPRGLVVDLADLQFPVYDIRLPFQQEPRFMSLTQLRDMSRQPELSGEVRERRDLLLSRLAQVRAVNTIADRLAEGVLDLDGPNDEIYRLAAPRATGGDTSVELKAAGEELIVLRIGRGLNVRQRVEAQRGSIRIEVPHGTFEPRVLISLEDVTVIDPELPTPAGHLAVRDLEPLALRQPIMVDVNKRDSQALYETVAGSVDAMPQLQRELERGGRGWRLAAKIIELQHTIRARVNERAAMAVNCLLVMLLGAVMSMLLRRQVPLAIFFWCFLPIVLSILMISSGANFMRENPWQLPPVLASMAVWVGNVGLALVIAGVYRRLNRN